MVIFSMHNILGRVLSPICFGACLLGIFLAINQGTSLFIEQPFACRVSNVKVFKFVKNAGMGWDEAQLTFDIFGNFTDLYNWSIKYAYYWLELEYYDLDRNEVIFWDAYAVRNQTRPIGLVSKDQKWLYVARTKKHSFKGITAAVKLRIEVIPIFGFVYNLECLPTVVTFPDTYEYVLP
ncbi:unnamed protein product [Blepharisma stoltei]|uniref:Signal peptidase complex subunit 3 n=1 Tax=Blepharisma stoltei TaxID=1481888 RepID=A0AAU9IL61_9CILI|nr:unnamed protein product [Blepharisma stoltei]